MRPIVCVSAVVPVLAAISACTCDTEVSKRSFDFLVDELELANALDADGNLTAEGCDALCSNPPYSMVVQSVQSCAQIPASKATVFWAPPESGSTGTTGDTGTSLPPPALHCVVRASDVCIGGRDHGCIEGQHGGTGPTALAAWLGAQAHAEATSVKAFVAMGLELGRFGAAAELVDRCAEAARDEVAHARILRRLCGERGGKPAPIVFGRVEERSLLAFAVENAVEGCVRETSAALVAAWQAGHAEQADLRAAYARIARDEARHGDLAWAIDAWVRPLLTAEERAIVDAARRRAVEELQESVVEPEPEVRVAAGLPDQRQGLTLLRRLDEMLWKPAMAEA